MRMPTMMVKVVLLMPRLNLGGAHRTAPARARSASYPPLSCAASSPPPPPPPAQPARPPRAELQAYLVRYFGEAGSDLVAADPLDFDPEPRGFLPHVASPEARAWALEVHVVERPERSSWCPARGSGTDPSPVYILYKLYRHSICMDSCFAKM